MTSNDDADAFVCHANIVVHKLMYYMIWTDILGILTWSSLVSWSFTCNNCGYIPEEKLPKEKAKKLFTDTPKLASKTVLVGVLSW